MDAAVVVAGKQDVAGHDGLLGDAWPAAQAEAASVLALVGAGPLGQARLLAVLGQQHVGTAGVLDGAAHDARVVNALAVVGEHAYLGVGAGHEAELGERLAL